MYVNGRSFRRSGISKKNKKLTSMGGGGGTAVLRVDPNTTSMPVRFQRCSVLTLYVRGAVAPGGILGEILRHCRQLQRVRIERKDNDWDAPDTAFALIDQEEMASALRGHPSLQDVSLIGCTSSVQRLCEALVTLPQLASVTIQADPHFAASKQQQQQRQAENKNQQLLSPTNLSQLLHHVTQRLSLVGLFPETTEYTTVLHDAFVRDACRVHIFFHFLAGSTTTNNKPSAFAYYIRQVMELNQKGRRPRAGANEDNRNDNTMMKLLQHVARRRNNAYSLDLAYLLIRDNPWLCSGGGGGTGSGAPSSTKKRTWKQNLRKAIALIRCRSV